MAEGCTEQLLENAGTEGFCKEGKTQFCVAEMFPRTFGAEPRRGESKICVGLHQAICI